MFHIHLKEKLLKDGSCVLFADSFDLCLDKVMYTLNGKLLMVPVSNILAITYKDK